MATDNIDIKVNVDSSNGSKGVDSLRSKMRELKEAGAQLQTQNKGTSASALEQAKALGELQDAMSDAQNMAKYFADDFRNVNTALQGLQGGIGVMTTLSAGIELFGGSSEAATEVIKKMQVAQAALNGVQAIQKVFNKDSYVMIAARVVQQKLLQKEIQKTAVSEGAATVATGALTAGEGAATTASFTLVGALKAVSVAIKSIPVIGWILAAVAALGTLISFIVSANDESEEGIALQEAASENLERQKAHYDEVDSKIIEIKDDLNTWNGILETADKKSTIYKETLKKLGDELGVDLENRKIDAKTLNQLEGIHIKLKEAQLQQEFDQNQYLADRNKLQQINNVLAAAASLDHKERSQFIQDELGISEKAAADYAAAIHNGMNAHKTWQDALADGNTATAASFDRLNKSVDGYSVKAKENVKKVTDLTNEQDKIIEDSGLKRKGVSEKTSKQVVKNIKGETKAIKTETEETKKLNDEKERQLKIERDILAETLQQKEWETGDTKQVAAGEVYLWEQRMLVMDEYSDEYYEAMKEKLRISLEGDLMTQYEYDAAIRDLESSRTEYIQSEEDRRKSIRESAVQEAFSGIHSIMDSAMSAELDMAEGNEKKQKQIRQKYAIANLVVNAAESAAALAVSIPKTLAAYSEIPFAGPVLAAIQIAATTASIIAQIANINKQKGEIMKAARGAFIIGPSHSQGGVTMEVEGGEAVLNKRAMAIPEYRALASYMNTSTGGVAFPGGGSGASSPIAATIDRQTIREIVAEVVSIPVVVSESSITSTQRRVSSIEGRSWL